MSRSMTFFMTVVAPILALTLACLGLAALRTNSLGWFLLLMGLAYLVGGPLYLWKRRNDPPARREERGDRSFWLVQPGFIIAIFGAPIEYLYLSPWIPHLAWMQILGWILLGASVVLHAGARQAIRGQFSGHVQIQPDHQLVQSGPYHYVRHPGYLGYLLLGLGVAIGFSSLLSLVVVLVLLLPGLVYRISVEEKLLFDEFGEEYKTYAHKTRRLVPGVW